MGVNADGYLRQLKQCVPTSAILNTQPSSNISKMLMAMADEFARFDGRMDQALAEWDPRTTVEMLEEWERVLGLPDPCVTTEQSFTERRAAVVAKLTTLGGQSRAFFIALAASLGYTITITEFNPWLVGVADSGDPIYSDAWKFVWQVNSAETTIDYADTESVVSEHLAEWGNDQLECTIEAAAPAHTIVNFAYGAQYDYLDEGFGSNFATDFHYVREVGEAPIVAAFTDLWTFARSGPGMYRGADGLYHYCDHNLFLHSRDQTQGAYNLTGATVAANGITAPDGTITADKIVETATTGTHFIGQIVTIEADTLHTFKVDLHAGERTKCVVGYGKSGSPFTRMQMVVNLLTGGFTNADSGTPFLVLNRAVTPLGDGWYRISVSCIPDQTSTDGYFEVRLMNEVDATNYAGDITKGIYIWEPKLRRGVDLGADFITTGAAQKFDAPRINRNPIDGVGRLLMEGSRTTRGLGRRDLTNAAWTKTNCTAARTVQGIDGVANRASRLTATGANATCLQAVVNGSQARRFAPFIRRVTGSGNIDITLDNGTTWTTQTIGLAWARVAGISQTLVDPTFGFRIVASGDVIEVDFAAIEDGTFDTSPLEGVGASATRAGDACERTYGAEYDVTKGSVMFKGLCYGWNPGAANGILCRDTDSHHMRFVNTPLQAQMFDGTVSLLTGTMAANTPVKITSTFGPVGGLGLTKGGDAPPQRGAFDGTWGTGTKIFLGSRSGAIQLQGEIEWIVYTPVEEVDTWLQVFSTP